MVFCPLYFFYIAIIILLFHDLIEVRVTSRIRAFGTSMAGLTTIVARNRSSRRGGSLSFYDLLRI
jgi:uncharacterized membrane protein